MGCQFQAKTSLYYVEKAISKGAELKTNFEALKIIKRAMNILLKVYKMEIIKVFFKGSNSKCRCP